MAKSFINLEKPKNSGALRIRHFKALQILEESYDGEVTVKSIVSFVAAFNSRKESMIGQCDIFDLKKAFAYYIDLFAGLRIDKAPRQEITINGKEYELVNMDRPPTAWVMDTDMSDFTKDPIRLACICYVPKGTKYGVQDAHDNMLYPIQDRYQDFKSEFPLDQFATLNAFFLRRYERLARDYMVRTRTENQIRKVKAVLMTGWQRLTVWRKRTTTETGTEQSKATSTTSTRKQSS
jgi:hypothetical protein